MNLDSRIDLLHRLGEYMLSEHISGWNAAKEEAWQKNPWFLPEFVELAVTAIAREFLGKNKLEQWAASYQIPLRQLQPKTVGIVMAGNIPLVGFHDFLSAFISGHKQFIKLASRDATLLKHLIEKMTEWNHAVSDHVAFGEMLKGCDAYIATGSNNSARYFEYYFNKYPNIIRKNRTSVAVLTGEETDKQLEELADDVYQYFGLGCRNVTKLFLPHNYNFQRLLEIFRKYDYLSKHNKYMNNYDYRLSILILNKQFYMTNGSILLTENSSPFSPISQLHYEYYENQPPDPANLFPNEIQCQVGLNGIPFGQAQRPGLCDYADGRDTLQFLLTL